MRTIISKSVRTPARSSGLFDLLEVAVGVGDGAGLLVEVGGGEDDVGKLRGLGEEHVLNDNEGIAEGGGIDLEAGDGVGADHVEGGEIAAGGCVEDAEHVEAGGKGGRGRSREACRGGRPCRRRRGS